MANNYAPFTIDPTDIKLTDEMLKVLDMCGMEHNPNEAGHYLYSTDGIDLERYWFEDEPDCPDWAKEMNPLQVLDYIRKTNNLPYIQIAGAFSCDKMRPGEFGGFEYLLTADGIKFMSTGELLNKFLKKTQK